jgi:hypothetical protein
MQVSRNPVLAPYQRAIASLTPDENHTLLLRALVLPAKEANDAWLAWCERVGSPQVFFERNTRGLKGLLPVVQSAVQKNEIAIDRAFATYLRAARLREELRLKIIREVVAELRDKLAERGISPIWLRGYPLAETIYPDPCMRHCHGLYLLVPNASQAAVALGPRFTRIPRLIFTAEGVLLKHSSRLPVAISSRLLQLPGQDRLTELVRRRVEPAQLHDLRGDRVSAADALLETIANAALSPSRCNLRWVIDSKQLLETSTPAIWEPFLQAVEASDMALPIAQILEYFRRDLDLDIPLAAIERVHELTEKTHPMLLDAFLLTARHGSRERFADIIKTLPDRRSRLRLIRGLVQPRWSLLGWRYSNLPQYLTPALYPWHLFLFARRVRSASLPSGELISAAV